MNDNATGAAGVVADDRRRAADHPPRHWSGALDRTSDRITEALRILEGCSRQEVQSARQLIEEALEHLEGVLEATPREGQRGSEEAHGAAPRDAEVMDFDPSN